MKFSTGSAIFFAASIALAIATPQRPYFRDDSYEDEDYPEDSTTLLAAKHPYSLSSAPFYYQSRSDDSAELNSRGRKYKIVKKKKKHPGAPLGSDEEDDEPQDDEEDSSEEEADEEEANEEESMDVPPWEELFPEDDKNTGTFDDHRGSGGYGSGGSLANLPGGAPAPESSGSLMNLLTGGYSGSSSESSSGPQGNFGGSPSQYRHGPPPPPGRPPYQAVRSRSNAPRRQKQQSGGAVLYDGVRYIPVRPVQVRIHQRQAKNTNEKSEGRSLQPSRSTRQKSKSNSNNHPYVLVPMERDSREIRFGRDEHGLRMEHGPMYAPTEIWRWEGPGGRPLRRRENRPNYPPRPQRGSSIRFNEDDSSGY